MQGSDKNYETQVKQVDGNYIPLFDLKLIAGKNLDDGDTANGFVCRAAAGDRRFDGQRFRRSSAPDLTEEGKDGRRDELGKVEESQRKDHDAKGSAQNFGTKHHLATTAATARCWSGAPWP